MMDDGDLLNQIQILLQEKRISTGAALRLLLTTTGELLSKLNALGLRVDGITGQVNDLSETTADLHTRFTVNGGVTVGQRENIAYKFILFLGKHPRGTLILGALFLLTFTLDVTMSAHWHALLAKVQSILLFWKTVP